MNRDQKSAVIEEIAGEITSSQAVFAVDYRGISVPQAAELRAKLRDADARFRVVKNSLTERAADQAGAEGLKELLEGPTAFTFVAGDAALAAKALNDFARATGLLPFKGGVMDGEAVTPDELRAIARLPSRDMLNAQLVGVISSPLTGLVRGLNSLLGGLAVALGELQSKKESGEVPAGEAPAPAAEEAPAEEAEATPEEEAAAETEDAPNEDAESETAAEEAPAAAEAEEDAADTEAASETETSNDSEDDKE